MQSQRFVAFIDCNFLGFDAGKDTQPDPNLANFYREFLGNEDAKVNVPSRVVFLANNGLKPSLNLGKHGIFAQAIIEGLKGKADAEGYEPDGNITVSELAKFVRKEQHRLARNNGKTDEEKGQIPVILEGQTNDFIVSHNPRRLSPGRQARLAKFDKLAQQAKPRQGWSPRRGITSWSACPSSRRSKSLRKAYQKLADGKIDVAAFETERKTILD